MDREAHESSRLHWNSFASELAEDEVRRVASLPVYDQFPLCQKCGSAPVSVTYREPPTFQLHSSDRFTAQTGGSMVYACGYCSFKWETRTKDAASLVPDANCPHEHIEPFTVTGDDGQTEYGTRCDDCGKELSLSRRCGACDPMGKGTCDLLAEPAHEVHRMQIRKGGWYSRCWSPGPDLVNGWIEGEICWRDPPERREPWPE